MYLSKLEMVGFKSFAAKTELTFTDGVTAIVGPNGCGKSNIVDAIRWVLGEQKSSTLRADSMEQVIFNGSKARKPLGMAEVSLTIENNKHILPTEYSQVVVSRRLFRNGESQYLLNRTQCRLRDIVDLFMDTGMGADAYSVIELKMIETILSDKADERRHLFEEAAGVTKYKARRREAQRKLETAQRDIARVQDIVREVQKTVNSLARQAEKARQHQELSTQLRELERLLFAFEYAEEYAVLQSCIARIAAARERRHAEEQRMAAAEATTKQTEHMQQQREAELRAALEVENTCRQAISDAQQQLLVLNERIAAAERSLQRIDAERDESQNQARTTDDELQRVRQRAVNVQEQLVQANESLTVEQQRLAEYRSAFEAARHQAVETRERLATIRQHQAEAKNEADRHRIATENGERRLREIDESRRQADERLAALMQQTEREQADVPALDAALAEAESVLHNAEARQSALRTEQEEQQKEADGLRTTIGHAKASLDFLVGLVDTAESSRFLMNAGDWLPNAEKVTLAEVVNASDDLRVAVEAALGDAGRYFVVPTRSDAERGIAALTGGAAGKATFLCRDSLPAIEAPEPLSGDGVRGWVSELVQVEDSLRGAIRCLVGRSVIVDTIESAWQVMNHEPRVLCAITVHGEVIHRSGAIRGGSASKTEGVRVGRRERIEALSSEIATLEQRLATIEFRLQAIRSELAAIDLRKLGEDVRRAAVARNERLQRLDHLRGRRDDIVGQLEQYQRERDTRSDELEKARRAFLQAQDTLNALEAQLQTVTAEVASAQNVVSERESALNEALAKVSRAEIVVVRLHGEVESLRNDEQRLSSQSLTIDQRREQRERERASLIEQLAQLRGQHEEATQQASTVVAAMVEAKANRERSERDVSEAQAAFHEAMESVRRIRRELDATGDELHEADLRHSEVALRIDVLRRRGAEDLDVVVPDEPVPPQSQEDPSDIRQEVQELRKKLTSMGNVNFLALEEHEREQERLTFLTTQLDDLTSSERTLIDTIAEINQTAREKFATTFERIRENFIELFKVLFTEDDEADLRMADSDDPLECTIEIEAKPRGKRPHSIEMLSGGEKTLTAIALLFAIYLVKPSPFCILDEVDAPLDDANIDRYLKLIRKFSDNTQFLMITHNKKTMEAADTLYGVTMEEQAVSKTVSVRLAGTPTMA
jgi:chromosome segregation protein